MRFGSPSADHTKPAGSTGESPTGTRWPAAALMRIGEEAKAAAWCQQHFGPEGSQFIEGFGDLPAVDAKFFEHETTEFVTTVAEAFRQGVNGYAQDITVQGRAASFDSAAIIPPVRFLHGEDDTIVPIAHGRHSAEIISNAELVTLSDHGHLSIVAEIPELCADLVTPLR